MRRMITIALLSLALLSPLMARAPPVAELGPFCWQLEPYQTDAIELSITVMSPIFAKDMLRLSGNWFSVGYQMAGAGAGFTIAKGYRLQLVFANSTEFFGGQTPITLSLTLNPSQPFNGTWIAKGAQGFTDALGEKPLIRVTCGLPLTAAQTVPAEGLEQGTTPGFAGSPQP